MYIYSDETIQCLILILFIYCIYCVGRSGTSDSLALKIDF